MLFGGTEIRVKATDVNTAKEWVTIGTFNNHTFPIAPGLACQVPRDAVLPGPGHDHSKRRRQCVKKDHGSCNRRSRGVRALEWICQARSRWLRARRGAL